MSLEDSRYGGRTLRKLAPVTVATSAMHRALENGSFGFSSTSSSPTPGVWSTAEVWLCPTSRWRRGDPRASSHEVMSDSARSTWEWPIFRDQPQNARPRRATTGCELCKSAGAFRDDAMGLLSGQNARSRTADCCLATENIHQSLNHGHGRQTTPWCQQTPVGRRREQRRTEPAARAKRRQNRRREPRGQTVGVTHREGRAAESAGPA